MGLKGCLQVIWTLFADARPLFLPPCSHNSSIKFIECPSAANCGGMGGYGDVAAKVRTRLETCIPHAVDACTAAGRADTCTIACVSSHRVDARTWRHSEGPRGEG